MIIVLNKRVLDTLLDFGFHLMEDGVVGSWSDGSPKVGFKVIGPRYLTRRRSKKIASSVMNDYVDVKFFTRLSSKTDESGNNLYDYLVDFDGKEYNLLTMYHRFPHYLLFMKALESQFLSLVRADSAWLDFIKEL